MNYADAFEQELQERKCLLGSEHPAVVETLNALGTIHLYIHGDIDQALCYHKEALSILQSTKTWDTAKNLAITLSDIANCYFIKNEFDKAHSFYSQSMKIFKHCRISKNNPTMYSAFNRLCFLSQRFGDGALGELYRE